MASDKVADTGRRSNNTHLRIPERQSLVLNHPSIHQPAPVTNLPPDLAEHPLFSPALAHYIRDRLSRHQKMTRKTMMRAFRLLWAFVEHEQARSARKFKAWTEVDDGFLTRLIGWMSNSDAGRKLGHTTKAQRYNIIRSFFEWLKLDRGELPDQWVVRKNPWPLSYQGIKSRNALSETELHPIILAATAEVRATIAKWNAARAWVADPLIIVPDSHAKISSYKREEVAVKTLAIDFPEGPPGRQHLAATRKGLQDAFRTYQHLSYPNAIESLLPTSRLLVPFVVLIGVATLFNSDTLLQLRWGDIDEEHPVYGTDRWRLKGEKKRAQGMQIRSFPARVKDITNPVELLKVLRRQTEALRAKLPANDKDHVFIFVTEHTLRAATFAPDSGMRNVWATALQRFIVDNNLPAFSLSNLRPTGSDLIDELTDGDLKAQQILLNHERIETTQQHYESGAAKRRQQEKLAQAMAWRERYVLSRGTVDSRGQGGSHRAATPGYECFDPYDSPMPAQVSGRMCSAYACCPVCPLHALNITSPVSLGRVLQLSQRLEEAAAAIAPQRWMTQWVPVQKAVAKHLHLFAPPTYAAASTLQLPPIPDIE